MSVIHKIVLLSFCLIFCSACSKKNLITIQGHMESAEGQYITISKMNLNEMQVIDSVQIQHGDFILSLHPDDKEYAFYQLSLNKDNALTTIAKKGEQLQFTIDAQPMVRNYLVEGSHEAELLNELDRQLSLFIDSVQVLEQYYYRDMENDSLRSYIDYCYLLIKKHHTEYLKDFICRNPQSLACLVAFYQKYNNGKFFSEENDKDLLKFIYDNLLKEYPHNENIKWLEKRIITNSQNIN